MFQFEGVQKLGLFQLVQKLLMALLFQFQIVQKMGLFQLVQKFVNGIFVLVLDSVEIGFVSASVEIC